MQLPTLPSWMRNGLPGGVTSNSPFPPLKPDKRYRGVYERAGFDVNLNALSGGQSPTLRHSPYATPSSADKNGAFSPTVHKHRHMERTPSLLSLPLKTPMSAPVNYPSFQTSPQYTPHRKHSYSARSSKNTALANPYSVSTRAQRHDPTALCTPQEESFNESSPTKWANGGYNLQRDRQYDEAASSSGNLSHYQSQEFLQQQPAQPRYQQFQPFQPSHRNDEGLHSILGLDEPTDKNKKQLKLEIHDSNFAASSNTLYHDARSFGDNASNGSHNGSYNSNQNGIVDRNYHGSRGGSHDGSYSRGQSISHSSTRSGSQRGISHPNDVESRAPSTRGGHSHRSNPSQSSAFSATSVQTSELLQSSAPYPTQDLGQIYTPSNDKDLSSMLADFKQDVEHHRLPQSQQIEHPQRGQHTEYPYSNDAAQAYNNAGYDVNLHSYANQSSHSHEDADSSRDDLSLGNRLRDSDDTGNSTAEDIPRMLHEFESKRDGADPRLSTISSILSKNDHSKNPDDEIERELERQLESLKTGSKASFDSDLRYNDSYTTASENAFGINGSVPSIDVSNGSLSSRKDLLDSELVQEAVTPLFARKDNEKFELLSGPATPHITSSQSINDMSYDTPETIKPLSPKIHHYAEFPERDSSVKSDEEILAENVAPQEFEAFPRSVFDPSVPVFRTGSVSKAMPGTGNCRTCHLPIEPGAKGDQRPIFSKSGELSGQWHRGCFKCSHDNCQISFNKQTPPYVLLDNPFCHHHYHSLNDTLCSSCNLGIEGECIENELRQKWHVNCLTCSRCREGIQNDYYCVNNEIYCERDASMVIDERKKLGLLTSDKVEKRRTRLMYLEQGPSF